MCMCVDAESWQVRRVPCVHETLRFHDEMGVGGGHVLSDIVPRVSGDACVCGAWRQISCPGCLGMPRVWHNQK